MPYAPFTILIADDDHEDLELLETAITDVEPHVDLQKATSGKAVIDYLASQPDDKLPCLIILDYNMPDFTGLELLTIIGKDKRYDGILKIIVSTSSAATHIQNCMNNGATQYLVKPNNMHDLNELAKKLLTYCQKVTQSSLRK